MYTDDVVMLCTRTGRRLLAEHFSTDQGGGPLMPAPHLAVSCQPHIWLLHASPTLGCCTSIAGPTWGAHAGYMPVQLREELAVVALLHIVQLPKEAASKLVNEWGQGLRDLEGTRDQLQQLQSRLCGCSGPDTDLVLQGCPTGPGCSTSKQQQTSLPVPAPMAHHAQADHTYERPYVGPAGQAAHATILENCTQLTITLRKLFLAQLIERRMWQSYETVLSCQLGQPPHHFLISVDHSHQSAQQEHVDGNAVPNARTLHFDSHNCAVGAQDSFVHLQQQAQAVVQDEQLCKTSSLELPCRGSCTGFKACRLMLACRRKCRTPCRRAAAAQGCLVKYDAQLPSIMQVDDWAGFLASGRALRQLMIEMAAHSFNIQGHSQYPHALL